MKNIIVAGAGHGGLTCAIHLAKKGYNVTVYEKCNKENIGHDWHDYMDMSAFDGSDLPRPDESLYRCGMPQAFRNPKGTVKISIPQDKNSRVMDRKVLYSYLIGLAEKAGVHFIFDTPIVGVSFDNKRIKGIKISTEEGIQTVEGDLVIDAAGMYSSIRKNLPSFCEIEREIADENIFHVFRAYYKNISEPKMHPPYVIDLFHGNRPGIGWTVFEKEYTDILIGKFGAAGSLTEKEVAEALESYRKDYPFISKEIMRGGCFKDIPLGKMLPLIVADGYAAVGDSASMTVPLNGSGINLSMKAGKLLADCILESNGKTDKKHLWKYQYKYFTELGKDYVLVNKLKNFFTLVDGKLVDYLLEEKVLSAELLACGDGDISVTPEQIKYIVSKAAPLLPLVPQIIKLFPNLICLPALIKNMPSEYNEEKVKSWIESYKHM